MKVKTLKEPEPVKGCSGGKCLENSCLETPKSVTEKTLDRSMIAWKRLSWGFRETDVNRNKTFTGKILPLSSSLFPST
jgi:hypothetical protein